MNEYFIITWFVGEDWHQSAPIAHGREAVREFRKRLDDESTRGVRLWEMNALIDAVKEGEDV